MTTRSFGARNWCREQLYGDHAAVWFIPRPAFEKWAWLTLTGRNHRRRSPVTGKRRMCSSSALCDVAGPATVRHFVIITSFFLLSKYCRLVLLKYLGNPRQPDTHRSEQRAADRELITTRRWRQRHSISTSQRRNVWSKSGSYCTYCYHILPNERLKYPCGERHTVTHDNST